jgi:hypothetical protein
MKVLHKMISVFIFFAFALHTTCHVSVAGSSKPRTIVTTDGEVDDNDFAARADWSVQPYDMANHAPVVTVEQSLIEAFPGQTVELSGKADDPDGDRLSYKWWNYAEAGTYPSEVKLNNVDNHSAQVVVPSDAKIGQTMHFILEVEDNGKPSLTRFQRIVGQIK